MKKKEKDIIVAINKERCREERKKERKKERRRKERKRRLKIHCERRYWLCNIGSIEYLDFAVVIRGSDPFAVVIKLTVSL